MRPEKNRTGGTEQAPGLRVDREMAAVFNSMSEGILIIDTAERIVFGNLAYCAFLDRNLSDIVGRPLREVRPGARLPSVLRTGKPILHAPRQEVEEIYFVNMYPIYLGGALVGGLSVVTFIQQAFDFQAVVADTQHRSRQVLRRISKTSTARYTFDDVVAVAPLSQKAKALAQRAAATDATVLLQSESGAGKEVYAQAIHNAGTRSGSIFLAINCANFSSNTLESELFGYVEGAFTGAKRGGKIGLFEAADSGTLFLDEVSEIEPSLQAKLLRVLQERLVRPLGAVEEREVDVRVIAACNVDLMRYVEEARFRTDLYYRLNTFPIHIPPLRNRQEDIAPLAAVILDGLSRKFKRQITVTEETLHRLRAHTWPGNVRELRNLLEFMACLSEDGVIREGLLPAGLQNAQQEEKPTTLAQRVRQFEREEILRQLRQYGSDTAGKRAAAGHLGISLASLYNKLGGTPKET